ncbi:hypothetical protein DFH07DRAFT_768565 [Mycena maculata]|uniref:Uncharacterized protein n=1 Tax=Mycena maculata TaxID=230809 RepID=A0AAD7NQI1_9AGAR|nr:hypothetical protein DFH07DRAFT_768565 [Mycena maculata]
MRREIQSDKPGGDAHAEEGEAKDKQRRQRNREHKDPTVPELRVPTPNELALVLDSLVASRALLMESGAAALRKAEGERKIVLNIEQAEVERVLGDVGGEKWRNILTG